MEIATWRDGSNMVRGVCGGPIYRQQPLVATTTHNPKKRSCQHFLCSPTASITVIGNGEFTIFKNKEG